MTIKIKVTTTIANEYDTRCPEDIPEAVRAAGMHEVDESTARAMLADAEFNSDPKAQDVGRYGMPLPVFNAYKALATQIRSALQ